MDFLAVTIPDHIVIDIARLIIILTSSLMVGVALGANVMNGWYRRLFMALLGVYFILQEAEQLGKPMLIWRLPLFIALCALGWMMMTDRMGNK